MGEFGTALKEERKRARKTLKETSDYVDKSIGYISDMEQSRTGAPDLELVRKFEEFFYTSNNMLIDLATKERTMMPTQMMQGLQGKPVLRDLFFRLNDMSDDELKKWLEDRSDGK